VREIGNGLRVETQEDLKKWRVPWNEFLKNEELLVGNELIVHRM